MIGITAGDLIDAVIANQKNPASPRFIMREYEEMVKWSVRDGKSEMEAVMDDVVAEIRERTREEYR